MYLSSQTDAVQAAASPLWAIAPFPSRVERVDLALRDKLRKSLDHIGEVLRGNDLELEGLGDLEAKLGEGPVSPWVFCLYSKLVSELSKRPPGDVEAATRDTVRAASLPAAQGMLAFQNDDLAQSWWDHFRLLIDTDPQRRFHLRAPTPEELSRCEQQIAAGLALLQDSDPEFSGELRDLLRDIVLASPASSDDGFNGASTFFFWGGALLNAATNRRPISVVDLLVHESSHVLLFGLSADGPLTLNSGHERYASPVRTDKRPIDGIFHACFVTTRVHLALSRLLQSGTLSPDDANHAVQRRNTNGNAAREAAALLEEHAVLTERGEQILAELRLYWNADGRN
jgi:HEXXH motif-containing protein